MEVGHPNDSSQLTLIGWFTLAVGAMILLFLLLPNPWHGRLSILFVAGMVKPLNSAAFPEAGRGCLKAAFERAAEVGLILKADA